MLFLNQPNANGWPQTGRNKSLKILRKGFTFMYAGDTHLSSIIHHGIDTWGDAGWSFCVPSTAAGFPRAWWPEKPGGNRQPGTPEYFGNMIQKEHASNAAIIKEANIKAE